MWMPGCGRARSAGMLLLTRLMTASVMANRLSAFDWAENLGPDLSFVDL